MIYIGPIERYICLGSWVTVTLNFMKPTYKLLRKVCDFVQLFVCEGRLCMVPFRTILLLKRL